MPQVGLGSGLWRRGERDGVCDLGWRTKGEGKASPLLSFPEELSDHQRASHNLLLENKFRPTSLQKRVSVFTPPKGQEKVHSREVRAPPACPRAKVRSVGNIVNCRGGRCGSAGLTAGVREIVLGLIVSPGCPQRGEKIDLNSSGFLTTSPPLRLPSLA